VHYDRPCYRVTFDDGSWVITDNIHLWEFEVDQSKDGRLRKKIIISTEDARSQIFNPSGRQRHLRVRNAEALNLPEVELPIHPYVLGAWLGDGTHCDGTISKPDDELFSNIEQCGYQTSAPHGRRGMKRSVYGLVGDLREAGVLQNKHIPAAYLRAGAEQRLMLLRGLMDTDGTWNRKRNQAVFNSTDKQLAHDVAELVRSLGWKAPVFEHAASGFGVTTTAYAVPFVPYDVNPFWLTRKAELVRMAGSSRARQRVVHSIESVPYVPTQCIVVDSPDSMFLCGEDMIPTHNCPSPTQLKKYAGASPENPVYDVQVDLYAQGCFNAGYPVANVGIIRLPRSGELSQAGWKHRAVNLANGRAALARTGGVAKMVETMGVDAIPMFPAVEHYCTTCDWYRPGSTDLTTGCPGAAKTESGPIGLGLPSTRPASPPTHMTDLIA
jgi:hypothetical protein